jgi:hypothetical protein
MTKWIIAAIVFGMFAIMFAIGAYSSANAVHDRGVQFLVSPTRRGGLTTADRASSMAFAAFISSLGCLGSTLAAMKTHGSAAKPAIPGLNEKADSDTWTCPNCHEQNPGNFEECWKCQRIREAKSA